MIFAIHSHESAMGVCVFLILNSPPTSHLPPHPIPLGHPSAPALSTLSHASNLDWQSISHMIIYMFQCYSLRSSHPRLLPQSPKVCSLHLCLFCCLAYRVTESHFMTAWEMLWFFTLFRSHGGSDGKESAYNAGDPDFIPGLGRSLGEGNG